MIIFNGLDLIELGIIVLVVIVLGVLWFIAVGMEFIKKKRKK